MSNKKMREEFEAWASSNGYELDASDDARFTYDLHETECAWYGWKASRAALCVELPSAHDFASDSCGLKEIIAFNFAISVVDEKLKSIGIKCK